MVAGRPDEKVEQHLSLVHNKVRRGSFTSHAFPELHHKVKSHSEFASFSHKNSTIQSSFDIEALLSHQRWKLKPCIDVL